MNFRLTHIIFLLAALWFLTSCQTDIIDDDVNMPDNMPGFEIGFAIPSAESRGISLTNTETLRQAGTQFSIFGDKTYLSENNSINGLYNVFSNTTVTSLGNNKWEYAPLQYWFPNNEYSFVAIHPMLDDMASVRPEDIRYSDSELSFTFDADLDDDDRVKNDDFTDIVVATHRRITEPDVPAHPAIKPIELNFRHMMALIDIYAIVSDPLMYTGDDEGRLDPDPDYNDTIIKNEYIQVRRVEFYGFKPKADFSFKPSDLNTRANQTDDFSGSIDVDYDVDWATMIIEIPVDKAAHVVNSGTDEYGKEHQFKTNVFSNTNDGIIMIPQTLAPDAKLVIAYTVNEDTDTDIEKMRTVTIPICDRDPVSGEKNQCNCNLSKSIP